jgi:hypothetical protein
VEKSEAQRLERETSNEEEALITTSFVVLYLNRYSINERSRLTKHYTPEKKLNVGRQSKGILYKNLETSG